MNVQQYYDFRLLILPEKGLPVTHNVTVGVMDDDTILSFDYHPKVVLSFNYCPKKEDVRKIIFDQVNELSIVKQTDKLFLIFSNVVYTKDNDQWIVVQDEGDYETIR